VGIRIYICIVTYMYILTTLSYYEESLQIVSDISKFWRFCCVCVYACACMCVTDRPCVLARACVCVCVCVRACICIYSHEIKVLSDLQVFSVAFDLSQRLWQADQTVTSLSPPSPPLHVPPSHTCAPSFALSFLFSTLRARFLSLAPANLHA